jgi:hypothetical protein
MIPCRLPFLFQHGTFFNNGANAPAQLTRTGVFSSGKEKKAQNVLSE